MEQWQQFQDMAPQLVPTILLTVTSQGRQNPLQKNRPVATHWTV